MLGLTFLRGDAARLSDLSGNGVDSLSSLHAARSSAWAAIRTL